mgnify:CR=1 FL=1
MNYETLSRLVIARAKPKAIHVHGLVSGLLRYARNDNCEFRNSQITTLQQKTSSDNGVRIELSTLFTLIG